MYLPKETLNISLQLLRERERKKGRELERGSEGEKERNKDRRKEKEVQYCSALSLNDKSYISLFFFRI